MRWCLAALLALLPGFADAQSIRAAAPAPPAATLPPIGLPLPEIGLPLPPLGLAPPGTPTTSPGRVSGGRPPRPSHPSRPSRPPGGIRHRPGPDVVYVMPAYPWYPYYSDTGVYEAPAPGMIEPPPPPAPAGPTGTLWLDVEPRGVGEVYVDGYLIGTAGEVYGSVPLEAGPHTIEVRAPGYQPLAVGVRIEAGRAITLRRTLQPSPSPPPPAAGPTVEVPRKPFYFIPGCYLGDIAPKDVKLPAGCDASKATVIRP
jgi:hypothetical protein